MGSAYDITLKLSCEVGYRVKRNILVTHAERVEFGMTAKDKRESKRNNNMEQKVAKIPKKANSFYPRKLVGSGGTRTLAVGKILPNNWSMVKVTVLEKDDKQCILKLEKLI